ncbi:MAG: hypothetical protein JWL73_3629 [Actinomycetia bacterium]|nr:hypothetical protein [Actinomycetes bacterium]
MTQAPPPPPPPPPPFPPPLPGPGGVPVPSSAPVDQARAAAARARETDYLFNFWTALGWTILTCGFFQLYVVYRLVQRSRDHNLRRLQLLDGAYRAAWDRAGASGLQEELRPTFERAAAGLAGLQQLTHEFRDPTVWLILAFFTRGIVEIVLGVLLDQDLVRHDAAEAGVEQALAEISTRLGAPLPSPDPAYRKQPYRYVARVIVTVVTLGFYSFWWQYNLMEDGNAHFRRNWAWEALLLGALDSGPPSLPG